MTERGKTIPFAVGFAEEILEDVLDATGYYDEESQTWKLEEGEVDSSSMVMSFPSPEKAPTTCIRSTRIGKGQWKTDTMVDD